MRSVGRVITSALAVVVVVLTGLALYSYWHVLAWSNDPDNLAPDIIDAWVNGYGGYDGEPTGTPSTNVVGVSNGEMWMGRIAVADNDYGIGCGCPDSRVLCVSSFVQNGVRDTIIGVSLWLPVLLLVGFLTVLVLPAPLRRWIRLRTGKCVRCGYDLRGNISGVCPECGAEANRKRT